MAKAPIKLSSSVVASKNQVSTELGGEAVILGVDAGQYFGLNEVGARIWVLVQQPIRVSALCETLAGEYDVDPKECERDALELLTEMQDKGLIDVSDAVGAP